MTDDQLCGYCGYTLSKYGRHASSCPTYEIAELEKRLTGFEEHTVTLTAKNESLRSEQHNLRAEIDAVKERLHAQNEENEALREEIGHRKQDADNDAGEIRHLREILEPTGLKDMEDDIDGWIRACSERDKLLREFIEYSRVKKLKPDLTILAARARKLLGMGAV